MRFLNSFLFVIFISNTLFAQETITFPSKDGLTITADEYILNDTLPYMILCHQEGSSRAEYYETAARFQKFGYNCLAIDTRSGEEMNGVKNETAVIAKKKKKGTAYLDADQDILSAIDYVYKKTKKKVILVGGSSSASLALEIATTNDKVKAVIAFNPNEYFGDKLFLKETIRSLDKPVFVSSSKEGAAELTLLMKDVKSKNKTIFIPSNQGASGSKALWKEDNPNYHEYWMSILMFMRGMSNDYI